MVGAAAIKGKDHKMLIMDLENLDALEYDPVNPTTLSDQIFKERRRKVMETVQRVMRFYQREEPNKYTEVKDALAMYEVKRREKQKYFEAVRETQRVTIDSIPMPIGHIALPLELDYKSQEKMPDQLVMKVSAKPKGILKSTDVKRKAPGPPPGIPPPITWDDNTVKVDGEDPVLLALEREKLLEAAEGIVEKTTNSSTRARAISFQDETRSECTSFPNAVSLFAQKPPIGPPPPLSKPPTGPPPAFVNHCSVTPLILGPKPGQSRPLLPPGPPPGPPPMSILRPSFPPGFLVRQFGSALETKPQANIARNAQAPVTPVNKKFDIQNLKGRNPVVQSDPMLNNNLKSSVSSRGKTTIVGTPVIRKINQDVTRFTPTAVKIKRHGVTNIKSKDFPETKSNVGAPKAKSQLSDQAYEAFMKEMEDLL